MDCRINERLLGEAVRQLVERERSRCLWFWRRDYLPEEPEAVLRAMTYIERYGSREAFLQARKIRQWLSQHSSGKSAD